jgi:hypothetical protein
MLPAELLLALRLCFGDGSVLRYGGADIWVADDSCVVEAGQFEIAVSEGNDSFSGSIAAYNHWCDDLRYTIAVAEQDKRERQGARPLPFPSF